MDFENNTPAIGRCTSVHPSIRVKYLSELITNFEIETKYPKYEKKVERRLPDTGESLPQLIQKLTEWAKKNMKKVMAHCKEHEHAGMKLSKQSI